MRTQPYWIPLALAATLMGKITVSAQDWRTVDDFALGSGNAEARGVAVDMAGGIYVVGTANGHGIVRYSADGGANWITGDDFIYPSDTNNVFNAVTVDARGDVFVGGSSGIYPDGHWIVRRTTDQGLSWETVDDYWQPWHAPEPGTNGIVYSLSSDRHGRVYGAGPLIRTHCPCYNTWWVRGSSIGGTNWDTKLALPSGYAEVSQLTCAGQAVYVTGRVSGGDSFSGLILKSSDYGATWTTNFVAPQESFNAIVSDSAGNVYSAGNGSMASNTVDWVVRKESPGGSNWTTLDRSTYGGDLGYPIPSSIAIDAAGNICVVGQFSYRTWFARQYSAADNQWSTTDLFSYYSTNSSGLANGTAIAPDGSKFVVGFGTSDSGQRRWVVRKQSAFTPRPRLQIAAGNSSVTVSWAAAYTNSVLEWTDSPGANQLWQVCTETVRNVAGQNTVTFELGSGTRFFRLKSAAGQ